MSEDELEEIHRLLTELTELSVARSKLIKLKEEVNEIIKCAVKKVIKNDKKNDSTRKCVD